MISGKERREVARRLRVLDYSDLQESLICAYLDALGIEGYADWVGIAHRLADLIEPSDMSQSCRDTVACDLRASESGQNLDTNRDTVPKESPAVTIAPKCDRDALLALADDIDKQTDGSMFDIWLEDGHYIARRIREALGVDDGW